MWKRNPPRLGSRFSDPSVEGPRRPLPAALTSGAVLTGPQRPSRHLGQQAFELFVLLVDVGHVRAVVVLLLSKQRQVSHPAGRQTA